MALVVGLVLLSNLGRGRKVLKAESGLRFAIAPVAAWALLLSILTITECEVVVLLLVCFLAVRRVQRLRVVFVEQAVARDVLASTSLDSTAVDPRRAGLKSKLLRAPIRAKPLCREFP